MEHSDTAGSTDSLENFSSFAPFSVKIEDFHGPIDLLLHLVKKNELEIETVSLAYVADQYVACLKQMRNFDLEIAGEYLVIAATLLSIKSAILLEDEVELELDSEGNLVDPHHELLLRLKEASVYKEGAQLLANMPLLGRDIFTPVNKLSDYPKPPDTFAGHDPFLLGIAFKRLVEKNEALDLKYEITLDSVSIVDRMMELLKTLQDNPSGVSFEHLVTKSTRANIVGTFIALLELCKRQVLLVSQLGDELTAEIRISLKSDAKIDVSDMNSEFDEVVDAEIIDGEAV